MEQELCPCCGKQLFKLRFEGEAIKQIRDILKKDPASINDWIIGLFTLMHNPESGKPLTDEDFK